MLNRYYVTFIQHEQGPILVHLEAAEPYMND
jgi:hypothetical protein